ncbi:hypothetical protein BH23ACT9_BH23ACT9_14170 [soil metagenome]
MQYGYHHGNLEVAARRRAGAIVRADGVGAVSMRAIARAEGVTVGALYRHHRSRDDLLASVAAEGFRELADAMAAPRQNPDLTPARQLAETGRAYLQFALANRGLFRLMFATDLDVEIPDGGPPSAFEQLQAAAEDLTGPDGEAPGEDLMAMWAAVHGLATLVLEGTWVPAEDTLSDVADHVLDRMVDLVSAAAATS